MSDRYVERAELPEIYIKKPLEWETFFQKEEHVTFSPATQGLTLENLFLVVALVKLSKTSEGVKILERIAIKYLDSCARIVESIQDSSSQNWLTALNNQHLAVGMMHRIGLLDDGAYIKIMEHYRAVFDKMLLSDVALGALNSVTTLVQGSKTEAVGEGKGGAEGIGALAVMLKGLMAT